MFRRPPTPLAACVLLTCAVGASCSLDFDAFRPDGGTTASTGGHATGGATTSSVSAGGIGGAGASGPGGTGGSNPAANCGLLNGLQYDFDAPPGPGTVNLDPNNLSNGTLEFVIENSGFTIGARSIAWYRFAEGAAVRAELLPAIGDITSAYIELQMPEETARFEFGPMRGVLTLTVPDGASQDIAPYDTVAHRWLQLRRVANDRLKAEVSGDGISFIEVADVPIGPLALTELTQVRLSAHSTGVDLPATIRFDNLNAGLTPSPLCDSNIFDFDLSAFDPLTAGALTSLSSSCQYTVTTDGLEVSTMAPNADCGVITRRAFHPTSVTARVKVETSVATNRTSLRLAANGSVYAQLSYRDGKLRCSSGVATGPDAPFDATYTMWRLRFDQNIFFGEFSADNGGTWTEACRMPYDIADRPHRIELLSYTNAALPLETRLATFGAIIAQP